MTARACILRKIETGRIDRERGEALLRHHEELEAGYRPMLGPGAIDQATLDVTAALKRQTTQRKRRVLLQMRAQIEIEARLDQVPGKPLRAMLSVLDFDPRGQVSGANVSMLAKVIRGQAHAIMVDFLDRFHSKAAGFVRETAGLRDVVRELFGESTGDQSAKEIAGAVGEAFEFLRRRFNAAGGDISKLEKWGLPQQHDRSGLAAVSREEWVEFTFARLDRSRMIDLDTGRPMSDQNLLDVLDDTYETVVSNGLNRIEPGTGVMRRGVVGRRQESRFLIFKGADAWLDYQKRFGSRDIFATIIGHIDRMARDTATIQVMGPSPAATLQFMEALVGRAEGETAIAGIGKAAARRARQGAGGSRALRDTYNAVTNALDQPGNAFWASIFQGNRNVLVSAMLGGAFFSALADRTFAGLTARINGVPAAKVLARHMKLFSPTSAADKRQAIRLGFTAEGWASHAIAAQRYLGEVVGPEWSKRLADITLRLSFLSPWTQAGRWGFMTEFLGFVTDQVTKPFARIPEPLQRGFRRHGISPDDWDILRAEPLWRDPETGAQFLRPQDVASGIGSELANTPLLTRRFAAADRLQQMIMTESEFAVPSTTARVKALLTGGAQPGTFAGELFRNIALFKSFPVTLLHTHLQRAVAQQGGLAKGKYIAHLVIGTMIMGALGEQLSQISKGRDPITMDAINDEKGRAFWLKALMRGGGLGIFGDFLFADQNRYGQGVAQTILGPVLGSQLPAATKLTIGNLQELVKEGEAKNAGRELTRFVKLMTPGRSLWYGTLAMERLIFDEMQKMLDPNAAESFRRIEQFHRRTTGQRFWSRPGRGLPPQRLPELEKATGG